MLPIEMDLAKIERLAIKHERQNFAFRLFLKSLDAKKVDRIVHRINKQVTSHINCLDCANCCHSLTPRVTEEEIRYLAEMDQTTVEEYTLEHLEEDKYDNSFFIKTTPCRYLAGNSCSIYEKRPKECRSYPYTHRRGFVFRTLGVISNYAICPIVFNVLENLKIELEFKGLNY